VKFGLRVTEHGLTTVDYAYEKASKWLLGASLLSTLTFEEFLGTKQFKDFLASAFSGHSYVLLSEIKRSGMRWR